MSATFNNDHRYGGPPTYYPWFDWLRAACACAVMLFHDGVLQWSHAGGFAVQVFFALSGWLIGGMLTKMKPGDLSRFYFNRAIRIWVPYYFALALLLGLSVLREPVTAKWLEIVFYKVTFVYNLFGTPQLADFKSAMPQQGTLNHVWSVNAEEQFYLLAPLLMVLGAKYFGRAPVVWVVLAFVCWITETYAAIVMGVLASTIVSRFGDLHLTLAGRRAVLIALALGGWALFHGINYELVAPIVAVCVVLCLAVPAEQHRWGAWVGGMSYPLYLNHWVGTFAFNFLMPGMRDDPLRQGLSAVANVVFALLLYWCIDRQLLERRNAWFTPARGRLVTVSAYAMIAVGVCFGFWMLSRQSN